MSDTVYGYSSAVKEQIIRMTRATLKDLAGKPDADANARALLLGVRQRLDERLERPTKNPRVPKKYLDLYILGRTLGDAIRL